MTKNTMTTRWMMTGIDYERSYSELVKLPTFKERYEYLRLSGTVGEYTFCEYRYLNQRFYKDPKWYSVRNSIIIRDNGCDLGVPGYDIYKNIYIHHINPITKYDILNHTEKLFDPENLICVSQNTHNAIHYGNYDILVDVPIERSRNDTCPWKKF